MKFVQTVLGQVPITELGYINGHEHLMRIDGGEIRCGGNDFLMNDREAACREMALYKQAGGTTIVEMTPCGCGRDIAGLVALSQTTGLHVIATTGFHRSAFYDTAHFIYKYSQDDIATLLRQDLEDGIDSYDYCGPLVQRTAAKAGVIKAAASYHSLTPVERKVLQAAGQAAAATGYSVSLHLERGTMALEVIDILRATGVTPQQIILGHIDRNPDLFYHEQLAAQGVYLLYDGPGRTKYYTDEVIAALIERMVERGWEKQLLIGADLGKRSYYTSYGGGPGMAYHLSVFLPRLRSMGISEAVLQRIFAVNAAEALAKKKS